MLYAVYTLLMYCSLHEMKRASHLEKRGIWADGGESPFKKVFADIQYSEKRYKSSAVAEMGDRGHNRHGPKRGGWCCAPFAERWEPV